MTRGTGGGPCEHANQPCRKSLAFSAGCFFILVETSQDLNPNATYAAFSLVADGECEIPSNPSIDRSSSSKDQWMGASWCPFSAIGFSYVSILARLSRRALQSGGRSPRARQVFQSSPAFPDGRFRRRARHSPGSPCFNPRPPFQTGASVCAASLITRYYRFNPRPPFQTGAS